MKHHHWLIIYDISDPGRLQKIGKIVSQYGIRKQKSVFEAEIEASVIEDLQKKLEVMIEETDFVVIIPLCEKDWEKSERFGSIASDNSINEKFEIL